MSLDSECEELRAHIVIEVSADHVGDRESFKGQ